MTRPPTLWFRIGKVSAKDQPWRQSNVVGGNVFPPYEGYGSYRTPRRERIDPFLSHHGLRAGIKKRKPEGFRFLMYFYQPLTL